MNLQHSYHQVWKYSQGLKTRSHYISKDILDPASLSNTKKNSAKKAILWVLSKSSHSVEEIAEHFEISPQLAVFLLYDLVDDNKVSKERGKLLRFKLRDEKITKES